MGTALTGQTKASTYDSLLKITDNGPVGGTEKVVTDGLGNDSALKIGTAGISSTGTLAVAGASSLAAVSASSLTLSTPLALAQGGVGGADAATARSNLGVTATGGDTTYAFRSNNLSDLANAATARSNLGLGTAATQATTAFDAAGAASSAQSAAIASSCQRASNLSDVANGLTALANLGIPGVKASVDGSVDGIAFYTEGGPIRTSRNSTTLQDHLVFFNANGNMGAIYVNGSTTTYASYSDQRAKENVRPYAQSGSVIDALQPRVFDWKSGEKNAVGFIAQELVNVFPEAVVIGDGGQEIEKRWMVDAAKLVPVLVAELKSLRARVAALEGA